LILLTAIPLQSQIIFDYVEIANTTTAIPNATGNFGGFTFAVNTGSNIAFYGIGSSGQKGIYRNTGGGLTRIMDRSTPVPGEFGATFFEDIGTPTVRGTEVIFRARAASGVVSVQDGIYRSGGGFLEVIADRNTPIPFGTQNLNEFGAVVSASGGADGVQRRQHRLR